MFFKVMTIALIAVIALFFITQILWPALTGKAAFPFFRKQEKLEAKISEARQALHEKNLEAKLESLNRELKGQEGIESVATGSEASSDDVSPTEAQAS